MRRPRSYLDWNASAPLRPEARAAMAAAMDVVGNPSSVHAEGRAARGVMEAARRDVAALVGCDADQVIFTSGATEAAALAAANLPGLVGGGIEHDCVAAHLSAILPVDANGALADMARPGPLALQAANSETGVIQKGAGALVDAVQAVGRTGWRFDASAMRYAIISAHKIGGPKGIGALIAATPPAAALLKGGGQERGSRAGTENLIGVAGFGAAAAAAKREYESGAWAAVETLRDRLEEILDAAAPNLAVIGKGAPRLPNTSCIACPGWRGETQVMAMDLAGFAVSAGSACSSGKVARASRALLAMGHDDVTASCAIRVSIGPNTTEAEVMAFADTWIAAFARRRTKEGGLKAARRYHAA
ncbi:cysteine desulfurase family protein [Pikeienuella sp. HZG-20]|uniref:cysteine desulfurase family protein n=1 Tax=Paludibacillus litoralis TaxID=3133267 RepID=UPI0030EC97ED